MRASNPMFVIEFDRESWFPIGWRIICDNLAEQKRLVPRARLVFRMFEGLIRNGSAK